MEQDYLSKLLQSIGIGRSATDFKGFGYDVDPTSPGVSIGNEIVPDNAEFFGNDILGDMSGKDMLGYGLAAASSFMTNQDNKRNYKLAEKALNDQLATSGMNRGLAAENYIAQQGVRDSLGSGFGSSSGRADDARSKFGKYVLEAEDKRV